MTPLEKMDVFFDLRADTYDQHMLDDLQLDPFYAAIDQAVGDLAPAAKLVDLGCGTGLELARLFARCPSLEVTGVDLSGEMLAKLRAKYPNQSLSLIQGSYFDVPLPKAGFDCALSTYSLHHFEQGQKAQLYGRIYDALRPGGLYVEGDYTCQTQDQQDAFQAQGRLLKAQAGLDQEHPYHFDIPFTAEATAALLRQAGFQTVSLVWSGRDVSILVACRA